MVWSIKTTMYNADEEVGLVFLTLTTAKEANCHLPSLIHVRRWLRVYLQEN